MPDRTLPPWLDRAHNTAPAWYRIENAATPDRAVVRIFDMIGGWFGVWADSFVQALDGITASTIELHVNSPGGDVFEAVAIMNALRRHPARVEAYVDGMAASAASYIVVGGADEVVMAPGSELMIHNPRMVTYGDAHLHRHGADRLDKIAGDLAAIYAAKGGGDPATWREAMDAETWYTAQEAVDAGLADRIEFAADNDDDAATDSTLAAVVASLTEARVFAYAGRAHAPAPQTPAASVGGSTTTQEGSPPVFTDDQLATMRQQLGLATDADPATITAALTEALAEQAEDQPRNTTPPALPAGVVAVEQAVLDGLRADAAAGRQAREEQVRAHREAVVTAAVQDGRIAPARRQHWLDALAADPGAEDTLAGLTPGLVPVNEVGHATADAANTGDDALYASIFGTEA